MIAIRADLPLQITNYSYQNTPFSKSETIQYTTVYTDSIAVSDVHPSSEKKRGQIPKISATCANVFCIYVRVFCA